MIQKYENWPIQPYNKFALALAYFPDATNATAATQRLYRWIKNNDTLTAKLAATGYHVRQHSFTSRQTGLIFEYLGEP